jgi:hypothetical protein
MFADPQTLTVNAVAKALVRINQDGYGSVYLLRSAADEFKLTIKNLSRLDKQRGVIIDRHTVEFIHTVFPVAPATLASVRKVYTVIENQQGDTLTDPSYVATALYAWLTASSSVNIGKLLNFES